ncbi:hypothetical protein L1987_79268 [Smallanthus sonchifolius]|uniref:Uncharacterized protein n=1 Tax=Smallanthus sonchifolius TaxID=185202 RepID=A0ACB8ZEP3_9ASTR|nr:hypothetical protein L1987_79268 [Smallanthus sonchifolius]
MTKDEGFKLLKIQTCILRVNLHCDGCKHKVKKLLQKIDGVYQVNIDAEQQKVTVSGSVDSATLIKKLVRAGKHAEIWSNKSNETHKQSQSQNHQNQKGSCVKDDKKNKTQKQDFLKGLESLKNQQKLQPLISEEDDEFLDDDDDDDYDEDDDEEHEEELMQTPKPNQLAFLRQQQQHAAAVAANNARNSKNNNNSISNNNINEKPIKGGSGNGKKGNLNLGEGKRVNDMSSVMNNLAGFGGGGGAGAGGVGGGDGGLGNVGGFGNLGGMQIPQKNAVLGSGVAGFHLPNGGLPMATGGYNPSSQAAMMMNMQNRQAMQHQQPQMMYNRSPVIPPATGYYYNYNPAPYTYNEHPQNYYIAANGGGGGGHNSAAYMFSDENTSSCSVM